jgi:hypothetical protein
METYSCARAMVAIHRATSKPSSCTKDGSDLFTRAHVTQDVEEASG